MVEIFQGSYFRENDFKFIIRIYPDGTAQQWAKNEQNTVKPKVCMAGRTNTSKPKINVF